MPSIDVVVPCYNYGRFLADCVASILAQPGVVVRVLIVDDASTDNTKDVASALAAADSRISYRRHQTNMGAVATFNDGLLGWAENEFCLLISADDVLSPGSLKRAVDLMATDEAVGFCWGTAVFVESETPDLWARSGTDCRSSDERTLTPGSEFIRQVCARLTNPIPSPTVVARTNLVRQVGGFRDDLPYTHDLELYLRMALRCTVGYVGADQALVRVHGTNMTRSYNSEPELTKQLQMAFEAFFSSCGHALPDRHSLSADVSQGLATRLLHRAADALSLGDAQAAREMQRKAILIHPEISNSVYCWKLRLKQVLGARVSNFLTSMLGKRQAAGRMIRWMFSLGGIRSFLGSQPTNHERRES